VIKESAGDTNLEKKHVGFYINGSFYHLVAVEGFIKI